jgi:BON domain-containing protein
MARRNRQQGREFRDREQSGYQGREGQSDYGRYDRNNPYYREGEGLHIAHVDEWGRPVGQQSRNDSRGRQDYGNEGSSGMSYPNTPFRGLRQRYQGSESTFGTGGRFSNFGVGRNTPVGYSGYGSGEVARDFDFDRLDYDDRTSAGFTGSFIGRGPKGYRRSDDRIREDVCEALTFDPYVDASEIEIVVLDGDVTLSGNVDDRNQKRRAEETAENVSGVRDVNNQIRANRGDFGQQGTTTQTNQQSGTQSSQQSSKETKRAA